VLAEAVPASGFVVLNANDRFTPGIRARSAAKVIEAGIGKGDVSATDLKPSAAGTHFTLNIAGDKADAFLPIPGQHMVGNATLAAAAAWQSGVSLTDIVAALTNGKITKGRLETKVVNGITFLDDSYNANPDSMKAGLRTLVGLECKGRRVAVLGQMGELGEHVDAGHREVGILAGELQLGAVFAIGEKAALITEAASEGGISNTQTFSDHETCANHLQQWLLPGDLVLVKGSRSAAMERVIHLLQNK
jgi:UDP-N-acetylmuramyl pentapeptide synthase